MCLGESFDFIPNGVMPVENRSSHIEGEGFDGIQINRMLSSYSATKRRSFVIPSEQFKIRLFAQVFDIRPDQLRQLPVIDVNPIIDRTPEAITLCRKKTLILIIQDKLHHRRILDDAA